MLRYNLYNLMTKVNNVPLTEEEVYNVFKSKYIYKKDTVTGEVKKIKTKDLRTVKCYIV